jgi:hypothetical protein
MKMTANTHLLPPTDFFALPLQARAGLSATLRGQPGLALQSKKIGVRRHAEEKRRKKACQPARNVRPMPRQPALQSFNNLTEIKIPPGETRRVLVHVFPYAVLYSIEDGFVYIVAVMHCSREPGYWKTRQKWHFDVLSGQNGPV